MTDFDRDRNFDYEISVSLVNFHCKLIIVNFKFIIYNIFYKLLLYSSKAGFPEF